jgi:hypothetical protein
MASAQDRRQAVGSSTPGLLRSLTLVTSLLFLVHAALAQTTGSVSGTVQDPSGSSVPSAAITVRNLETNAEFRTVSSEFGNFRFPSLLVGNYELNVVARGFRTAVVPELAVHVGLIATVKINMAIESIMEQVTVLGEGQQTINTVAPELTALVDRRQMLDLPSAGRDAMSLLRLQAGVAVPSGTDLLTGSIHGLRSNMTNLTQDGINVQDNVQRGSLFAIGRQTLDDIGEFTVAIGTISSDSGTGAAQVKMVTPSGTNEFHGSLFEFHRNKALNANLFFNNQGGTPKPALIENKFGGRLGGPLILPGVYDGRNRTFFFGAIEVSRQPGQTTRDRTVWTEEARTGIFKYRDTNGNIQQVNLLHIAPVYKDINPITKGLLDKTPPPNNGNSGDGLNTRGYRFLSKQMNKGQRITWRIDHNLTGPAVERQHRLELVISHRTVLNRPDIDNGGDAAFPGGQIRYRDGRALLAALAIHSTFGPRLYNEIRAGTYRTPVWHAREADDPLRVIIPFPQGIGNSPQEPTALTSYRNSPVYHLADNVSFVRENHLFKWGIEARSTSASQWSLNGPPGGAGTVPVINLGSNEVIQDGLILGLFPGLSRLSDLTTAQKHYALLVGLQNTVSQTFNVANLDKSPAFAAGVSSYRLERYRELNLYFSDQWYWRPNFSWNLGVRYELVFPPTIVSGGGLMPERVLDGSSANVGESTLVLAGPRDGRPFWRLDKNNFAPFVGFAYQPRFETGITGWLFGNGRTSIRGGYTISYTRDGFSVLDQVLINNQGLQQRVTTPPQAGVLTSTGISIPIPTFKVPINDVETYEITAGTGGFWSFDPNLRTPYVQQWSFGFERELPGRIAIEARYAGNHAQALLRGSNLNEVDIFENGFLQEFKNAKGNLDVNGGTSFAPGGPGTLPLPIFSTLFAGLPGGFTDTNFIQQLKTGEAGRLANLLSMSTVYRNNRASLPANFFKPYPNLNFARHTSNVSHSTYNALQLEARRRFATRLSIQANYTFSKTLTDGENPGLDDYRTLRNRSIEKHLADWNVTHTFNANYLYDLPIGPRYRFHASGPFLRKLMEGWQISGLLTWHTAPYKTFTTMRMTVNQVARMMPVPVGNAVETIRRNIGVFRTPQGVFWLNPDLLNIAVDPATGLAIGSTLKDELFRHPEAGEIGYLGEGMFKSPRFFQTDFSIMKKTRINETVDIEFRTEFFNFLNNANFIAQSNTDIDSPQLGRITNTYTSRFVQLTMRVNW